VSHTLDELQPIFRSVFENQSLVVDRTASALSVDGWDSLAHINLIAAIEEHFGVRFALGELEELQCVGDMVDLIERKRLP
jgi:acyl carrier protein